MWCHLGRHPPSTQGFDAPVRRVCARKNSYLGGQHLPSCAENGIGIKKFYPIDRVKQPTITGLHVLREDMTAIWS